jgi:two-component system probable response regulator PhcQ
MPDKTGTQLLQRVRRSHPDIVRLLATAYSDLDAAIDAVNSGAIYKYLVKPWDVRDLRMTLRRAMDYFLLKRERDLLLREKLSSLQHLLVADRVRSLAILAEGLSSQIRNTMTALSAYVELAREQAEREPKATVSAEERWRNLRWETEDATGHLLRLVQRITAATVPSRYDFDDQVALGDLLESSWGEARREAPSQHARLDLDVAADLPLLRCNRAMLERTFTSLFRTLLPPELADDASLPPVRAVVRERTRTFGTESIVLELLTPGFVERWHGPLLFPTPDLTLEEGPPDLLAAFFVVHHHGGTICLGSDQPGGSGFQLALPFAPERAARPALGNETVQKLFSDWSRWETLERGG